MIQVDQYGPVTVIRMARGVLGRPLDWAAAYYVDGLLIDAGPRCTETELVRVLRDVEVKQIVVTHGHEAQTGGLHALLARYPTAKLYAPRRTLPLLAEPARLNLQRYRRLVWGTPRPVTGARPLDEIDDRLVTGDYMFRVIETPGHSHDHIALFEPNQRWLFTGDTYLGGRERAWSEESDMFTLVGSLRTLANLRPERLFPGTGNVRRNPLPDLHEKISYYVKLCQEVGRLSAAGFDFPAIRDKVIVEEPGIRRWTLGHYSSAKLIRACLDYNALVQPAIHQLPAGTPTGDRSVSDSLRQ